jgi:uncharacterized protein (TIGR02246 family)
MTDRTAEDDVRLQEQRYWNAIKDRDAVEAMHLTHDPCIVTGAQGVSEVSRESFVKMMDGAAWTLDDFELEDVQVRLLGDDVAIVAYKVKESLTVEGKPVKLEAADSSTWIRRDGRWLCALHTEAISGDPFGRDRQPAVPHQAGAQG